MNKPCTQTNCWFGPGVGKVMLPTSILMVRPPRVTGPNWPAIAVVTSNVPAKLPPKFRVQPCPPPEAFHALNADTKSPLMFCSSFWSFRLCPSKYAVVLQLYPAKFVQGLHPATVVGAGV